MTIEPLMSLKFVLYPPLPSPAVACTALVRPPAVAQVITTSLVCCTTERIRSADRLLVGLVPARNSLLLLIPSPSGSASAAAAAQLVQPKYCICHCWNAVTAVI